MKEFYRAPKYMIERTDLTDAEKMMLLVIANLSEKTGYCYAKNATLALMLGWGVDKTRNTLRILKTKGILKIDIEDNNRREIYILEGVPNDTGGVKDGTGGVCDFAQGGCVNSHRGGVPNDTPLHNRTNTQEDFNRTESQDAHLRDGDFVEFEEVEVDKATTNQPKSRKEKVAPKRKEVVMPWDSQTFAQKWQLWKEYKKKEHRFGFKSEVSEQIALKKLTEVSNGQEHRAIELIETAISNGWKGIHEVTQKKNTNGHSSNTADIAASIANQIAKGDWDITKG
jgi:hypothetical protein